MPELASARHEAFARAIVAGSSGRDAYRGAGYKPKTDASADAAASRLLSGVKVAARVAELKAQVAERVVSDKVMSLQEVLEEQSKLGRANMADVVEITVADDIVAAVKALPREHSAAIQELTVESYQEPYPDSNEEGATRTVKKVKFKLHDKRGALTELRRHHEPDRHQVQNLGKDGQPVDPPEALSELEVARRIAFALELGARAKRAAPAPAPARKAKAKKPKRKGSGDGKLHQKGNQAPGRADAKG